MPAAVSVSKLPKERGEGSGYVRLKPLLTHDLQDLTDVPAPPRPPSPLSFSFHCSLAARCTAKSDFIGMGSALRGVGV